jgi:hypothetical protein
MGWLLGIVILVVALYFRRVSLPIVVVLGAVIGGYLLYTEKQQVSGEKAQENATEALRAKVSEAQQNIAAEAKTWQLISRQDPTSGKTITRAISIQSDDGLCRLRIQARSDGSKLSDLACPGIAISEYQDIDIRFDDSPNSQRMDLVSYGDSEIVYIAEYQPGYQGYMPHPQFIDGLGSAAVLAIQVPALYKFWTRFTLTGSSDALAALGKEAGTVPVPGPR